MSVEITFKPADLTGLVAEGTGLLDAARRMGVRVSTACAGPVICTGCKVLVISGSSLLSLPTDHEIRALGEEAVSQHTRLACQTIIERSGELVIEIMPEPKNPETPDMRKAFQELPLDRKLATLIQLEALTMSQAFDAAVNKTLSVGGKLMNRLTAKTRTVKTREHLSRPRSRER